MHKSIVILVAVFVFGCGDDSVGPGDGDQDRGGADANVGGDLGADLDGGGSDGGATAFVNGLKARDATGRELGWVLEANLAYLWMLSPKRFMYSLHWDGTQPPGASFSYAESNCQGVAYASTGSVFYGRVVFRHPVKKSQYIPANLTDDGTAVSTKFQMGSQLNTSGECEDYGGFAQGAEFREATEAETGVPDIVNPPIELVEAE